MKKLSDLLFAVVIFLIPTNLFLVLSESGSRVHGLRVDYLLPKLYLSDIVLLASIVVYVLSTKRPFQKELKKLFTNKRWKLGLGLFALLSTAQFLSVTPILSFWLLGKLTLFACFLYVAAKTKTSISGTLAQTALMVTILFQSIVGIVQWVLQKSIAGFWFLGETDLSSFAGLAKTTLGGVERVLPYGTTAHPNVLGGVLALYMLLLFALTKNKKKSSVHLATFLLGSICLLLTQSLSAWLVFVLGMAWIFIPVINRNRKKIAIGGLASMLLVSLLLPFVVSTNPSLHRRSYLSYAGLQMFVSNPITGVGLGAFTTKVENYSPTKEVVRFVQPAHNVAVLVIAELGVLGLATVLYIYCYLLGDLQKNNLLFILLLCSPLLFFDHYLYTLQTGQLLFLLLLLFSPIFIDKKVTSR